MKTIKIFSIFLLAFSLLIGGVVNAAMPCCMQQEAQQMQMEDGDTPCHEQTDDASQQEMDCQNCDCMHFVNITNPDSIETAKESVPSTTVSSMDASARTSPPYGIFQPPRI